MSNPLVDDATVDFLLYEVHDALKLAELPAFEGYDRDTFEMFVGNAKRLAREHLYPAYVPMDRDPPKLVEGRVRAHPVMSDLWSRMVELGLVGASRPESVGGASLPLLVSTAADVYLMAANLSAFGYVGLTRGAAHLIETFGDDALRTRFMDPMLRGEWTGTMALTEPSAGSSLADITTKARPTAEGHYLIEGAKIFISAADHGLTPNVVNMTLARIEGAPAGTGGISLFAVPTARPENGSLVDNDVRVAGAIHKIGWRGLPSLALAFGERGDCRGWLVGTPHRGLACMFQMMNEARIMVGLNGVATASVAYHESLAYARDRTQGRSVTAKDPTAPPLAIVRHADVRRMLLRQKAIVEGGLALVMQAARYADLANHAARPEERERAHALLDLLTPMVKSFPAERGYESNTLALQVHGGYGYTSEYLPEAWLRDQKLNSIHEGTTGIQALDLLGRKTLRDAGRGLAALGEELTRCIAAADEAGVDRAWGRALGEAWTSATSTATELGRRAQSDLEASLGHATDFLDLMSTVVVAWQWLSMATCVRRRDADGSTAFGRGKLAAAEHFLRSELPRVDVLARRCLEDESYVRLDPDSL